MPSTNNIVVQSQSGKVIRYVVFDGEHLERGTAEQILRSIQDRAKDKNLKSMSLDEYARILVDDAAYFLPKAMLEFLEQQEYPTSFDKALVYLANMQSSQVRILSKEAA